MDIAIWMLVGAILGCGSYSYLGVNEGRGIVVAAVIGAVGGILRSCQDVKRARTSS